MDLNRIEKILDTHLEIGYVSIYGIETSCKEIYKLHLESQLELLESLIEHPTKPEYKRYDVLDKIKKLETKLKELK
jgi:hypothetical protein